MKRFVNHCLDRLTYGARPEDIQAFVQLGGTAEERLAAWVEEQLDWQAIDDSAFEAALNAVNYTTLNKTLVQQWTDHHVDNNDRNRPVEDMERLVVARALHSKRQLLETLSDFWHNHFSVFGRDFYAQSTFVSWDRDVIRPPVNGHPRPAGFEAGHLLGNFRQMLELSSRHAAMQYYLDCYINQVGGPNENYAREVMELHTLGAENYEALADPGSIPTTNIPLPWGPNGSDIDVAIADRYVDDDVYAAMRMLTGWKIKDHSSRVESNFEDTAEPFFYEPWHDKFEKTILGHHWGNNELAPDDIRQFFDIIAFHPGTARHIAGKLCRRFISPTPPQSVIDEVATTFYANRKAPDQLEQTYRTLFNSSAFRSPAHWGVILKRPMEAIISALRVTGTHYFPHPDDPHSWNIIYNFMERAGQRPFYWRAPNGYPMNEAHWLGSNTLMYVMRAFDWMADRNNNDPGEEVMRILAVTQAVGTAALPDHSPNHLVTFWLDRLLGYTPPGGWEGTPLHDTLVAFMRQHPDNASQWPADVPFEDIGGNWPDYVHERLRGLVKLILSTPQFLYR